MKAPRKALVIDFGGTSVKILASSQTEPRKFPSGKDKTPAKMVAGVKKLAKEWEYDVVLGGGNAKRLTSLPQGCPMGSNANAFLGGFKMWEEAKT